MISRRELLRILGGTGAAAVLGCGGRVRAVAPAALEDRRAALRDAVAAVRAAQLKGGNQVVVRT